MHGWPAATDGGRGPGGPALPSVPGMHGRRLSPPDTKMPFAGSLLAPFDTLPAFSYNWPTRLSVS